MLPKTGFKNKKHIGVGISSVAIRGIELDSSAKVTAFAESVLPDVLISGSEVQTEILAGALKYIVAQGKFTSANAAVCIPEKYAFSREHVLPTLPLSEITEAINWQVEKILPFTAKDVYIDWKLLEQGKEEIKIQVIAVQRNLIDSLKYAFEAAGLFIVSVEPSATALSRLVVPKETTHTILLEVDLSDGTATLLQNGVATITTTASFQAESDLNYIGQEVTLMVKSMLSQIKQDSQKPKQIELMLSGPRAEGQLLESIKASLQLPGELLQINAVQPAYQVAYAAAQTVILPPSSEKTINVLPSTVERHYKSLDEYALAQKTIKIVLGLLVPSLALAIVVFILSQMTVSEIQGQLDLAKSGQLPQAVIDPNGPNVPLISKTAQRINRLFPLKETPEEPISIVLNAIPDGVSITNISYANRDLLFSLTGVAQNRETLIQLQNTLDATQRFSKIKLPLSSLGETENIGFSLEFTLLPPTE